MSSGRGTSSVGLAVPGLLVLLLAGAPVASAELYGQAGGAEKPVGTNPSTASAASGCWIRGERRDLELRISRLDSTTAEMEGGTVKVCYSRPRKLGRPIMGRLVPYGEPWRLGANEATALHLSFPATVAGVEVEPGSYSLYAVPGETSWRIVVNADARRWGIPIDEEVRQRDIGAGTVSVERLEDTVERLTIRLRRVGPERATMRIEWERTGVSVPIMQGDE